MKTRLAIFLITMIFCFNSCTPYPNRICRIMNLKESQIILLENQDEGYVHTIKIKIEGNMTGKAKIILSDVEDARNGITLDLEKNLGKVFKMDWYSDQCYLIYIPDDIVCSKTDEILVRYEFLTI